MRGVESDCSHMVYQFFSQRQKEDVGDGGIATLSNAYRQHSPDIVQRLVLVKVFYKLSLIGLGFYADFRVFFLFCVFPPRELNASKITPDD